MNVSTRFHRCCKKNTNVNVMMVFEGKSEDQQCQIDTFCGDHGCNECRSSDMFQSGWATNHRATWLVCLHDVSPVQPFHGTLQ